jgi:type II secretory pathway pseudopilin PulG
MMNTDFHRSTARYSKWSSHVEGGFSTLELLVIVVIVCVVAAIGVPTLRDRAKESVLKSNLVSLASLVDEKVADGYSSRYRPSGKGDPAFSLSNHLEEVLKAAQGKAGYRNPFSTAEGGRVVLNSGAIPTDPLSVPPAVLITDSPECQYLLFDALPEASRRLLRGTLIVDFNDVSRTVDVFYADDDGKRSNVVSIPIR